MGFILGNWGATTIENRIHLEADEEVLQLLAKLFYRGITISSHQIHVSDVRIF